MLSRFLGDTKLGGVANGPEDKNKSQNGDMLDKFQIASIMPPVNLTGYMLDKQFENNMMKFNRDVSKVSYRGGGIK